MLKYKQFRDGLLMNIDDEQKDGVINYALLMKEILNLEFEIPKEYNTNYIERRSVMESKKSKDSKKKKKKHKKEKKKSKSEEDSIFEYINESIKLRKLRVYDSKIELSNMA